VWKNIYKGVFKMNTAETLRLKSDNLKKGIRTLLAEIVNTNTQITNQIAANEAAIIQAHANVEQFTRDNEELRELKVDNETFVADIEKIVGEALSDSITFAE
jgi:vacuolar-type H+-ATPase subunit D/Vma8